MLLTNLFHASSFLELGLKISFNLYFTIKILGNAHDSSMCLEIVFSIKVERILFKDEAKHFLRKCLAVRRFLS